jgi:hypothetical protein
MANQHEAQNPTIILKEGNGLVVALLSVLFTVIFGTYALLHADINRVEDKLDRIIEALHLPAQTAQVAKK